LKAIYPELNSGHVAGDFGGSLAGRGERLVLSKPDQVLSTNSIGLVITNMIYIAVDEVTYRTGGRWGNWANQGGSSLELVDPKADNELASNWKDSDETAKGPWTTIERTGRLEWGNGNPNQLEFFLQGEGECLVDNIEVVPAGQANRVLNGTFDNGASGWFFQGTQRASAVEPSGGFGSGACLHLKASGRGDTGPNRVRSTLSSALTGGTVATIRAKVRWLKGNPYILFRLHGNALEATGRLLTAAKPGTPGAQNSTRVANAGPAINDVSHWPVLPADAEAVTVTARIDDPDGIAEVLLHYRNDTANGAVETVRMFDDGTVADATARDGLYSALMPGLAARSIAAFYIEARDGHTAPATRTLPEDAPTHECLVGFGEAPMAGAFGTYRLWATRTNVAYWTSREKNSNDPVDATFAYGDFRVIYNMQALFSGSPFHTGSYSSPGSGTCDYVMRFPDDDRLLGANDFVLAMVGNLGNDGTGQREQAAFWIARELGIPFLNRRYICLFFNGARRSSLYEDTQQPNSDVLEQFFPDDSQGQLYKVEDWFEFDTAGRNFDYVTATLEDFRGSDGNKITARYRWNFRPRAVQSSPDGFAQLFTLVDVLHAGWPEPYTSQVDGFVDVDNWMRNLALQRIVGNWDSFGYSRGKNMYLYKPPSGPWEMLSWDIDFVLGLGDPADSGLMYGQDPSLTRCGRTHI
jgi:hypothetical protein